MLIDPIQILLAFVIITLTILLVIIGLEFFAILKEFKKTVAKINKILDDTGRISGAVAKPIEEASEFIVGLKKGFSFFSSMTKLLKEFKNKHESEKEIEPVESKEIQTEKAETEEIKPKPSKSKKKRFFTHKGKILTP